jgi:ComF family protein
MGGLRNPWPRSFMRWLAALYNILGHLIRISLFQPRCVCCQNLLAYQNEKRICHECREQITPCTQPACRKCGKSIRYDLMLCGECLLDPPPFRKHVSYARYEGLLKEMILGYKYKGVHGLRKELADYMVELYRRKIDEDFDWVVPVPDDPGRKRERKPVQEIGRRIACRTHIPLMKNNLIKVKKTEPQVGLSRAKRLKNLDGAFGIRNKSILEYKKILLIDDVYTTGTTIKKCSIQLRKAGAEVVAMTLARSL